MDENIIDACGNPIEFGECYGYTINQNGFTTVTFGIADRITETGMVTLSRFYKGRALYDGPIENPDLDTRRVSVKPINLFPVKRSQIARI